MLDVWNTSSVENMQQRASFGYQILFHILNEFLLSVIACLPLCWKGEVIIITMIVEPMLFMIFW